LCLLDSETVVLVIQLLVISDEARFVAPLGGLGVARTCEFVRPNDLPFSLGRSGGDQHEYQKPNEGVRPELHIM
jgi:hypothetical protein